MNNPPRSEPLRAALADLERDRIAVFGPALSRDGCWAGHVEAVVDPSLEPEVYVAEIDGDSVRIRGGDDLGVVYGIYAVSHRVLGVDPLWFWKDLPPQPRTPAPFPKEQFSGTPPRFRFRGFFLNDEDLLAHWGVSSGIRFQDHPDREAILARPLRQDDYERRLLDYYSTLPDADVLEKFYEAVLRLGGNLVIPASFVDVMNPAEADWVRRAVRRGLYVSTHHVEPLGVSHYAFETWWAKQGKKPAFSFRESPRAMRETWRAYARRWWETAGDRLVWQVGLRGRGDRPLWDHDPAARDSASELISNALQEQVEILRETDSRPTPPITWTLWSEGSRLAREGRIRVPRGVTLVFSDNSHTLDLQEDFRSLPREPGRPYGCYCHAAVWTEGPHLVQGVSPWKMNGWVREMQAKGDTEYAILNVANFREMALQAAVWADVLRAPDAFDPDVFLATWAPAEWIPLIRDFFSLPAFFPDGTCLYDGGTRVYLQRIIQRMEDGESSPVHPEWRETLEHADLSAALARLDGYLVRLEAFPVSDRWRAFFDANLRAQATILRGLYKALVALLAEPPAIPEAMAAFREVAERGYSLAARPPWQNWYDGDKKIGIRRLRARLERILEKEERTYEVNKDVESPSS